MKVTNQRNEPAGHDTITLVVDREERIRLLRMLQVVMDLQIHQRQPLGLYVDHSVVARDLYQGIIG